MGGVSAASAAYTQPFWDAAGAIVVGRRLFDLTNGWNGVPVVGDHMFVVTHTPPADWVPSETLSAQDAPVTFVTTGVADAIARAAEVAGDRVVTVTAGNVGGQALAAGLVDEVAIDVVPVVFGAGRPYFGDLPASRVMLEDPEVVQGDRVLHLRYRVRPTSDT
jgi:dihydrofolate reductase